MNTDYRDTLYKNYHSTQSGRAGRKDKLILWEQEKLQFSYEILPLLKHLPKNAVICDVGCGSGSLLAALKDAGFSHAFGVDVSPEQIAFAKEMGQQNVYCQDFFDYLKENDLKCDVVLGMDIIEHFTKTELVGFLQDMKKSLNEGGMVLFRTPNLDAPMSTVFANGDFTHENYMNQSSAEQVVLASGFTQVQVSPSFMRTQGVIKELFRKVLYTLLVFHLKLQLFATARSTKGVIFTPNLIIKGTI